MAKKEVKVKRTFMAEIYGYSGPTSTKEFLDYLKQFDLDNPKMKEAFETEMEERKDDHFYQTGRRAIEESRERSKRERLIMSLEIFRRQTVKYWRKAPFMRDLYRSLTTPIREPKKRRTALAATTQ